MPAFLDQIEPLKQSALADLRAASGLPLPKGEGRPALHSAFDEGGGEGEGTVHQPTVHELSRRSQQPRFVHSC
jgi:hypothetical protein